MRLVLPSAVQFTCSRCGDCCRDRNVLVSAAERRRLETIDWRGLAPDLVGTPATVATRAPGAPHAQRLARRLDGACIFLGEANECRLHSHFGAEAKPTVCRLYPLGFREIGDHVAVDAAFSCRAVSLGQGAPLAESVAPLLALLAPHPPRDRQRHEVVRGRSVTGAVLLELEETLVSLLEEPTLVPFDRVRAALEFLRLATTGDPATPAAFTLRAALRAALPARIAATPAEGEMDESQRAFFFVWLWLALNPSPHDLPERPPAERDRIANERAARAARFQSHDGPPTIRDRDLGVSFDDIARVDPGPFANGGPTIVTTYLAAKLLGQRFLVTDGADVPFQDGACRLLLHWPMALWTAKALAAERGAARLEEADVRAAIRLLDSTLGTVDTERLAASTRAAWDFLVLETNLVVAATLDLGLGLA